jgi:hypothetical protein
LLVLLLAGTASCGGGVPRQPQDQIPSGGGNVMSVAEPAPASIRAESATDAEGRAAGGPNINPTAAPGVAFNYRYSYALAAQRVGELQEQHAAKCEALGLSRCRIIGMRYQVLGPNDIQARLELKLDPTAARTFGREATVAVLQADGQLTESEITGVDAGSQIRQAGTDITRLQADLTRTEQQLARRDLDPEERAQLQSQAEQLRDQIRALGDQRQTQQESLATTPMVFNYGSGDLVPGYQPPQSLGEALGKAGKDFLAGAQMLLVGLIRAAPWLLALLLIGLAALFVRRRWFPKTKAPETAAEPV